MLRRLQIFAAEDDVALKIEMDLAPPTYDSALDLVANDCDSTAVRNTTHNEEEEDPCNTFDIMAVDYYYTKERALRIEYTPAWLHGAISAVKYIPDEQAASVAAVAATAAAESVLSTYVDIQGSPTPLASTTSAKNNNHSPHADEFITMEQASAQGLPVCVVAETSIAPLTFAKFPNAKYIQCPNQQTCIDHLKAGNCVLYVDDRLQLRYRAVSDPTLVVSSETFNPQYVSWIMNERKLQQQHPMAMRLFQRWIIAAHQNGTFSELYEKYFEKEPCPIGRSGTNCQDSCDVTHGRDNGFGICKCTSPKWTGVDCSIPVPEDLNMIPQALKVIAYALLGINFVAIVGCGLWLLLNRYSAQVTLSQPSFLVMVLLGCAISSSAILAMAHEEDEVIAYTTGDTTTAAIDSPACMATPWLYSVGFCVTFGTY